MKVLPMGNYLAHSQNLLIQLKLIYESFTKLKKYSNFIKDKNLLVFRKCNIYYIGESSRCAKNRISEHLIVSVDLIKTLDKCSEVAIHFNIIDLSDDIILINRLTPEISQLIRNRSQKESS
ncbi:hypothetical protein BpHYR1_047896 [Brachionus plicatilis]|uniref:GIY-YIG domain-containing protein n=1 Tax=Brachionus plicatilis TaxID=10195 RepID=A0A3M7PI13_BRAPC|nr:hypothetical protein BpHYR1_047896 [Brachionus plicatilis]